MGEGHPDLGDQASDGDLVRRTLAGEEQAFEVLVHRYRRLVFRVIRGMVPSAEVEDIGQEAFLRAYRSLAQVQRGSSVGPWLARIAVNLCYDHLRRPRWRQERSFSELGPDETTVLDRLARDESAFGEIDRLFLRDLAEKLLGQLTPQDRAVLLLKEREGMETREVASILGCSEMAVRLRLFRARRALRTLLGGESHRGGREG